MKEIFNRGFIILQYKEPYRVWAEKYNELDDADLDLHMKSPRIYMVDFVDPGDNDYVTDILRENYRIMFEMELMSWSHIKEDWPSNIDFTLFVEWFHCTATDIGYDLGNEALVYDE